MSFFKLVRVLFLNDGVRVLCRMFMIIIYMFIYFVLCKDIIFFEVFSLVVFISILEVG